MSKNVSTTMLVICIVAAGVIGFLIADSLTYRNSVTDKDFETRKFAAKESISLSSESKVGTYPVRLKPSMEDGNKILEVSVREIQQRCNAGVDNGCLLFKEDHVGFLKFYLDGYKYRTMSCASAGGNKVKEVITEIRFTTEGSGNKGTFGSTPDSWLKVNAFPSVDQTTGIAYKADVDEGRTQVFLANLNNHDREDGTKTFWYQVQVESCNKTDTVPWVSDPRGDNEGTNYN